MSKYLTAEEERDLVLRGQAGDVEARNRLLDACQFLRELQVSCA